MSAVLTSDSPRSPTATVLVVGGYGEVGRHIVSRLAETGTLHLIIAGRDLGKAQRAAAAQASTSARRIDLGDAASWEAALRAVDAVMVCIDQTSTAFAEHVIERGVHYLDVTASDELFRAIEALPPPSHARVLLSLGLAPGLSNLLAVAASSQLDHVERIEIGLLMGLGDAHGKAAIEWSVAQTFRAHPRNGAARVDFGMGFGERNAHFMDFADQHTLMRSLPGVEVITRVAYDSRLATAATFWLGRVFAGNRHVERLMAWFAQRPLFGSDACVLSVHAHGTHQGRPARGVARFAGRREAEVTAHVAALAIRELLAGAMPAGVSHSHQVLDATSVLASLCASDAARFELERLA